MDNKNKILVDKKEYDELVERSEFLSRLEAAGVDNWEGYCLAFENEDDE